MTSGSDSSPQVPGLAVHLNEREADLVSRCLRAVVEGPWLWPGQIEVMLDVSPAKLREVAEQWPDGDGSLNQTLAVDGSLLVVAKGIRFTLDEWNDWIGVPRGEVVSLFEKIRSLREAGVVPDWEKDPEDSERS